MREKVLQLERRMGEKSLAVEVSWDIGLCLMSILMIVKTLTPGPRCFLLCRRKGWPFEHISVATAYSLRHRWADSAAQGELFA